MARAAFVIPPQARLRAVRDQLLVIRVRYAYDGFGRIVGRRVEVAPVSNGQPPSASDWAIATPDVVASQPLPAATTFVWDPVTDNLLAIFPEGASRTNAAPLRQFIHGSMAMDDPIEVVTADARLFPIFGGPGTGTLQAVISETGQLLARGLGDPTPSSGIRFTDAAIDRVECSLTCATYGSLPEGDPIDRLGLTECPLSDWR